MLVARLFTKIYKKGGIVLIDSSNQKFICGNPNLNKPLTLRILNKKLNWKLIINPDLSFPEAYMNGDKGRAGVTPSVFAEVLAASTGSPKTGVVLEVKDYGNVNASEITKFRSAKM